MFATKEGVMATVSSRHVVGRPQKSSRSRLGKRIEEMAARRGWTIEELAAAGGIAPSTVYRVITAETPDPKVSTIQAIASALGVTVDKLLADEPPKKSKRTA
jgi:XRE family transcriptional regulator, fatty acid utilization regulator